MPQEPLVTVLNGVPLITRKTLPLTWRDSMSPAMAMFPSGAAAPGTSTFAGTAPNELVLQTYVKATNDRSFFTIQIDHDADPPSTGANLTLSPHVHWTMTTSATTNTYVEWKLNYSMAKPGTLPANAGTFSSVVLKSTGRTTMPVTAGAFAYKHLLTELQDITVASSNYGASFMIIGSVQASSDCTLDSVPMLLALDIHYQARGGYTISEYA